MQPQHLALGVGAVRMHRAKRNKARILRKRRGEGVDVVLLVRVCGDVEYHRAVNTPRAHLRQQPGGSPVGIRGNLTDFSNLSNRSRRQRVREKVAVEVNKHDFVLLGYEMTKKR